MDIEFCTRRKLKFAIAQIDQLLLADFPHDASRKALSILKTYFDDQLNRLDRASGSGNQITLTRVCITLNERLHKYLPVLGFLLRSTNIRNSFELYDALQNIATSLIGPDAQIILSSEWEFSPLTYAMSISALPDHVLIGMPSSESSNALIIPLAGHELGHTSWVTANLESTCSPQIDDEAKNYLARNWHAFLQSYPEHSQLAPNLSTFSQNMFIVQILARITGLVLSQIEEIFCDAIGAKIFGESFVHSFFYLLAPDLGGQRPLQYPRLPQRADFLATLSGLNTRQFGYADYASNFQDVQPSLSMRDTFVSQAADAIATNLAPGMFKHADQIVAMKALDHVPDETGTSLIYSSFLLGMPAHNPRSLSDILNAGWRYVREHRPSFDESERSLFDWVSELVLKSVEVMEFNRRVSDA